MTRLKNANGHGGGSGNKNQSKSLLSDKVDNRNFIEDHEIETGLKFYPLSPQPTIDRNSSSKDKDNINSDFGGPIGSILLIFLLPLLIYILNFSCTVDYCLTYSNYQEFPNYVLYKYPKLLIESFNIFKHFEALSFLFAWWLLQLTLAIGLPGKIVKNSESNSYKLNGFKSYIVTILIVVYFNDKLTILLDYYIELINCSIFISILLSVILYFYSFRKNGKEVVLSPNVLTSSSTFYDFFIGRELNPKFFSLDLKLFCELRPGLMLWNLLNLSMLLKEYELYNNISLQMLLINLFQFIYVLDALYNEESILTTIDIKNDGFGFMLIIGDLAWVPFTFNLQCKYLLLYRESIEPLSIGLIVLILMLNLFGYLIFRLSNNEKHKFKKNELKNYTFMLTENKNRLLVSGWWGRARKINYTGDALMGLSWCLVTGTKCWISYYYVVYLVLLLSHRAKRDERICENKYGEGCWGKYKEIVPFKFVPDLY